jgi:tetratricopeptide (TPR) repeat protein
MKATNSKIQSILRKCFIGLILLNCGLMGKAQINTDQVMNIGKNALYFEDYILSIQYFNQVIKAKPWLADPYFYRAVAKLDLEDYRGAEEDCSLAIERNPFIIDAYQVRGIARQTLKKSREAIADYDEGLKQMPEHKIFLMNKAVCQADLKDYDNAEKTYSRLISIYPNFSNAYLGRAQLLVAKGDTVSALSDIDKSISLNKNEPNAYVMRAEIEMHHKRDYKAALADMDQAITLEPHYAGYFINRAFMKYNLDDYFGAMSDYNYAVDLDPTNVTAHFNRGLLRTEVSDNNKAIEDFTYVLRSQPDNFMARYNRALLYQKTGQYKRAVRDFDVVLKKYPKFEAGIYARAESRRLAGDMKGAEHDYNYGRELFKQKRHLSQYEPKPDADKSLADDAETQTAVMNKFNTLLTVETNNKVKPEYEDKARGHIQDNNVQIDPEPMFFLSYYDKGNKLRENTNYVKEVTEVNSTKMLPFVLVLTNAQVKLYEDQIQKHFSSIEYYNGLMSTSTPRSIDYFARALDYMMVKNPAAAIQDLNNAIKLSPKFSLAYMARATANFMSIESEKATADIATESLKQTGTAGNALLREKQTSHGFTEIISDLDRVLEFSPSNVYAMFNKGNIYLAMQDYTSAISAYSEAISAKPDFGEAYYNRGLVYMRLGNKEKGVADLSKAGELGILPSYNVLKRMGN